MNVLSKEKRAAVLHSLAEGCSMRATSRLTNTAFNSVVRLLIQAGKACTEYQDKVFVNLPCKRVQCDEIWSFVGAKEKTCTPEMKAKGKGDVWTWTALCSDTKLVPCWFVGTRDASAAYHFMHDLAPRLRYRVQLTTDGHKAYLNAVEDAFGAEIDYGMLIKLYGATADGVEVRYSPAQCIGSRKTVVTGKPDFSHISTSHTERHNLTIRMQNRRFTRLTNAFSKKLENLEHSVALYMMHYNFCRIHKTLRVTPAMEAGIADHVWTMEEVVDLIDG